MKGTGAEELLYFVAIFFSVLFLFVFLTYQMGTKGAEVRKSVEERLLSEEITGAVYSLFNNKHPIAEKTYMKIIIDAFLKTKEDKVYYGVGIGSINVTNLVSFLDNYAKGRWELKIVTPDGEYTYGGLKKREIIYSYETLIPIPEERIGKVILLIGA